VDDTGAAPSTIRARTSLRGVVGLVGTYVNVVEVTFKEPQAGADVRKGALQAAVRVGGGSARLRRGGPPEGDAGGEGGLSQAHRDKLAATDRDDQSGQTGVREGSLAERLQVFGVRREVVGDK